MMQQATYNARINKQPLGNGSLSLLEKRAAREILLLCATANVSPAAKDRLSYLLSKKVNWSHLLELAEFHEMMPLVYHNLTRNGFIAQIPKSCSKKLKETYNSSLFRNVLLSTELETVLAAFKNKGIAVIVVKGTVLAEQLYGNPGLRIVGDMDILVRPESLPSAGLLLEELGYRKLNLKSPQKHPFHDVYQKPSIISYNIELHWNLDDCALVTVPLEIIWQRAKAVKGRGDATVVLSPEDVLIHLCNNLSKPSGRLLRNLCDITELMKQYQETLDWDYVIKAAHSWRIEPGVYFCLKHSSGLLEVPVPAAVVAALKPSYWRRWALNLLIGHENFLLPIKWDQLRVETSTIVRCLTIKPIRRMMATLSKYRGNRKRARWLRTLFWINLVFGAALMRNAVKAISKR
jgi:hypothetical protein